jgi:4-diphosphocytidyl-2-C-methyl-D-erythritol kinase
MKRAPAAAKINLALVVGPPRDDGKHEVLTVLQRIDLVDRIELAEAPGLAVEGFAGDTLVTAALQELARSAGVEPA